MARYGPSGDANLVQRSGSLLRNSRPLFGLETMVSNSSLLILTVDCFSLPILILLRKRIAEARGDADGVFDGESVWLVT
jgi:hypothetical protein